VAPPLDGIRQAQLNVWGLDHGVAYWFC